MFSFLRTNGIRDRVLSLSVFSIPWLLQVVPTISSFRILVYQLASSQSQVWCDTLRSVFWRRPPEVSSSRFSLRRSRGPGLLATGTYCCPRVIWAVFSEHPVDEKKTFQMVIRNKTKIIIIKNCNQIEVFQRRIMFVTSSSIFFL